jgi:hypothetical protein
MSTNPDRIVNLISTWLAGRITDEELGREIDRIGADDLAPDQAEAVGELREELDRSEPANRADLERVARETLEAVALG